MKYLYWKTRLHVGFQNMIPMCKVCFVIFYIIALSIRMFQVDWSQLWYFVQNLWQGRWKARAFQTGQVYLPYRSGFNLSHDWYFSQLPTSACCIFIRNFLHRSVLLTRKFLNQGFIETRLRCLVVTIIWHSFILSQWPPWLMTSVGHDIVVMLSCHLCLLISCYSLVYCVLSFDCSFCLSAWYLYFLFYRINVFVNIYERY